MDSDEESIDIRAIEEQDLDAMNELLATHQPWTDYDLTFEVTVSDLSGEGYVATVDNSLAGFIWWLPHGMLDRSPYIKLLAVHRAHQSSGIGRILMDQAESEIADSSTDPNIFLLVSDFNEKARAFYRQRGYVEIGPIPEYIEEGIDEVLMQKQVS